MRPKPDREQAGRRFYIGIAVANPAPRSGALLAPLEHASADVLVLAEAFEDRGYQPVDVNAWVEAASERPSAELSVAEFRAGLRRWLEAERPGPDDSLVFYFSGHALRGDAFGKHYLCFRDCDPKAPSSGFPVNELPAIFLERRSALGRAWFILDCCYAAQGAADMADLFAGYEPLSVADVTTYWVTSSCGKVAQYDDGAFSKGLARALENADTMEALQQKLKEALGPRARQIPRTRQLFGAADFLSASSANTTARRRPTAQPALAPRSRFVAMCTLASTLVVGSVLAFARLRTPVPTAPNTFEDDMAWIGGAEILLGETETGARRAFHDCRTAHGAVCGERFESSVFAREARAPGAPPVMVKGFYLDRTEVSHREFVRWLNSENAALGVDGSGPYGRVIDRAGRAIVAARVAGGGPQTPKIEGRAESAIRYAEGAFLLEEERADTPVVLVSWYGADRFCKAHRKRLPTEEEWELAARGATRQRFPWGDTPPERCSEVVFARAPGKLCETAPRRAVPVGTSLKDVSRDGVRDLAGNVAEWTSSLFEESSPEAPCGSAKAPVPCRVFRGGSYRDDVPLLRGSARGRQGENEFRLNIGFRCAREGSVKT